MPFDGPTQSAAGLVGAFEPPLVEAPPGSPTPAELSQLSLVSPNVACRATRPGAAVEVNLDVGRA